VDRPAEQASKKAQENYNAHVELESKALSHMGGSDIWTASDINMLRIFELFRQHHDEMQ